MDMSNTARPEHFLTKIDSLIDWAALGPLMRAISVRVHADVPLAALKMLLLARWYGMSEDVLLEACHDRISFRRFLGLPVTETREDARHAEAFRRNVKQAPMEAQSLIHAIEAQLLSNGYTVKPGMWAEAEIVPVASDALPQDTGVTATTLFPTGAMAKLRLQGEGVVARGGGMSADNPPPSIDSDQSTPREPEPAPVQGIIEWPWGATTVVTDGLQIGREFGFCPFAHELQPYRHMSRRHAELQVSGAGIWVRDLHSHNRTFVNDEEIPPGQAYLVDSDSRIRCGPNFVVLLKLER